MAMTTSLPRTPSSRSLQMLLVFLVLVVHTVQAQYSLHLPGANTVWMRGQQIELTIVSRERATAGTGPDDSLLRLALEKGGLFSTDTVILDGFQVLIPVNNTTDLEAKRNVAWTVPENLEIYDDYSVVLKKRGLFFTTVARLPKIRVVAATVPTATTGTPTPTATASTSTPTPTNPASACEDIQQQCVAQARIYNPPTDTQPCSCGDPLPQPKVKFGTAAASVPLPHKTSSGAVAALVVLVMALVGMF